MRDWTNRDNLPCVRDPFLQERVDGTSGPSLTDTTRAWRPYIGSVTRGSRVHFGSGKVRPRAPSGRTLRTPGTSETEEDHGTGDSPFFRVDTWSPENDPNIRKEVDRTGPVSGIPSQQTRLRSTAGSGCVLRVYPHLTGSLPSSNTTLDLRPGTDERNGNVTDQVS